jgi:hypothetical protein
MNLAMKYSVSDQLVISTGNKICTLLEFYAAWSGNSIPTFQGNLFVPYSGFKKSSWTL